MKDSASDVWGMKGLCNYCSCRAGSGVREIDTSLLVCYDEPEKRRQDVCQMTWESRCKTAGTGGNNMDKIVQTAGRNALGEFAPDFAHFNDDVLFGENWNNEDIDLKTRCIITVVALMAQGITDSSLKYHLQNAKDHGVSQKEMAAVITHVAFYAGWPKAWAVFHLAKEVWE